MKSIYRIIIFLLAILGQNTAAHAQCVPFDNCLKANCVFNAAQLESGSWNNSGYTNSSPFGFCGTTETDLWFPVFSDTSGTITITLYSENCVSGNGMQLALYPDCSSGSNPIACNGGAAGGASVPITLTTPVTPGTIYYLLVDGFAGDICDFTFTAEGVGNPEDYGLITGQVLIDLDQDCEVDSTDVPAAGFPVTLSGIKTYTRPSDAAGLFHFIYADTGAVTLTLGAIPGNLWTACQNPFIINPPVFPDSTNVVFLLQPDQLCASMQAEVGLPPFFRPCQQAKVKVDYCNVGSVTAEDATVEVVIPGVLGIDSTSLPVASQSGDTLVFAVGDIAPLTCGTFQVYLKPPCNGSLNGQTLCIEAHAYPDTFCTDPANWSGAHVTLSGRCIGNDVVEFTLRNTGPAAMIEMQEYIIIEDEVVLRTGEFQLGPGESMIIDTAANGATWRVEAGQEPGHPGFSMPAVSIEGCGGLTPGLINAFPQDDADWFIDIECRTVIASYDPNIKTAIPEGAGPNRLIRANTPLEYTIHFQNTGTDTAFTVRLVDVLPPTLDVSSFRPGTSSHPCGWQINGDTLQIIFQPIILPDSNVNEPASHGWFDFSIRQKPDLADGTLLENRAAIYFDYNDPVITDPAWHTVGQLTVSIDPPVNLHSQTWALLGNPTATSCIFQAKNPSDAFGNTRFELYDMQGRLMRFETFSGPQFEFHRQMLPAGSYVFRLIPEKGAVMTGKLVLTGY